MAWDGTRVSLPELALQFVLFAIGAIAMRGAVCTWNDILDRDFDAQVERTRGRPIPAGEISVRAAMIFLIAQSLIGLAVLLSFPLFAIIVGAASLLVVAIYPLMKRLTDWNGAKSSIAASFPIPTSLTLPSAPTMYTDSRSPELRTAASMCSSRTSSDDPFPPGDSGHTPEAITGVGCAERRPRGRAGLLSLIHQGAL